jgi:photosystem II stability/assembly factor-like uncharacterized protein
MASEAQARAGMTVARRHSGRRHSAPSELVRCMMQRISGAVLILVFVSLFASCGGGAAVSPPPIETGSTSITTISADFNRKKIDAAVSPDGTMYVSAEGLSDGIHDMYSRVFRSTDRGRTWEELQTGIKKDLFTIAAPDNNTVVAATKAVYLSNDRASTWSIVAFTEEDPNDNNARDMYFLDANQAVLSKGGSIYYSGDEGRSWQEAYYNVEFAAADCDMFSFPDKQTGYCAGGAVWMDSSGGTNNGNVLKTIDGGKSWTSLELYPRFHMAAITGIQFISPSTGFIFTFNREMFKTSDGGVTWNLVSSNVPAYYAYPFFADERTGVIATHEGNDAIYETTDGGTTWRKIFDAPSGISRLRITNRTTAYFVGRSMLGKIVLKP